MEMKSMIAAVTVTLFDNTATVVLTNNPETPYLMGGNFTQCGTVVDILGAITRSTVAENRQLARVRIVDFLTEAPETLGALMAQLGKARVAGKLRNGAEPVAIEYEIHSSVG